MNSKTLVLLNRVKPSIGKEGIMNPKKIFIVMMALVVATFVISLTSAFAQVSTAWVKRYAGGCAYAIAVDSCGNIYVTGQSGGGPDYDYLTIKYYPKGDIAWVRTYDGPGNDEYGGRAIAVYGCDRVYVTGTDADDNEDLTIAYDAANGTQLWVGDYGGNDIAVDGSGNVYVTGMYHNSSYDYLTAKYRPDGTVASGWPRTYDGPGHRYDGATAVAVDGPGNVYVTGYSDQDSSSPDAKDDYATIKYDSLGNELWVERYDYSEDDVAYDIAVDDSGNVCVTGWSDDILDNDKRSHEQQTGYGNTGTESLHYRGLRHKGPPLWFHFATVKYRPDGDTAWVRRYSKPGANAQTGGEAIAVDGSGNVYVLGSSEWDYATIKYRPNGETAWVRSYNGPGYDWAEALAVDDCGNVYVTGYSGPEGTPPYFDYATIKYDSLGTQGWVERYNGPTNGYDHAFAITVDDSGNVYVTGGNYDYAATIKYIPSGWFYPVDPSSWTTPAIKVSPGGFRDFRFGLTGIYDIGGNYQVTSNNPKVTIDSNATGYLWSCEEKRIRGTIHCSDQEFVNATITIHAWIGTEKDTTLELPLYAVCSNDYYECDLDSATQFGANNGICSLWTCANTEERLWDTRIEPEDKQQVIFSGGVIAAFMDGSTPIVGRQDYRDTRTGARDTIRAIKSHFPEYPDCDVQKIFVTKTYVWYMPDIPQTPKWYWLNINKQILYLYDSNLNPGIKCGGITGWPKELVIKHVWINYSQAPAWWPNEGSYLPDGHPDIYYGVYSDIDAPFDTGCHTMGGESQSGCNAAGWDGTNKMVYQSGYGNVVHPTWANYHVGMALTNVSGAIVTPLGCKDVRNAEYLYPQDGWGWQDSQLYRLAITPLNEGTVVDNPDSVVDRSVVMTAGMIPAGSTTNFLGEFILIEALSPTSLADLQNHIINARTTLIPKLNKNSILDKTFPTGPCGDIYVDGVINASDVVYLQNYLYIHGPKVPWIVADVDHSATIDAADVVALQNYLYIHGPAPSCFGL